MASLFGSIVRSVSSGENKMAITNKMKIVLPGWFLIARDDDGEWYVAWHEQFERRRDASDFAKLSHWSKPWRAVRGYIAVARPQKKTK